MKRALIVLTGFLLLVAVAAGVFFYPALFPVKPIVVASWGGPYAHAQGDALFHPYTDKTGTPIDVALYNGGIADIEAQVKKGKPDWDVVDFELDDAVEACSKGLLEVIDDSTLPPGSDGKPATQDFVPGAIGRCFVGSIVYAQIFAYAPSRAQAWGSAPSALIDFFDLEKFPGARGMRDTPRYNLEMALLADGVASADVYRTLATPEGLDRAFRMVDRIKPALLWYENPGDAMPLLKTRAAMVTALNARAFEEGDAARTIWDGQVYALDVFGIPKGADMARALDFIAFATGSAPLARVAEWLPYGPARRSALSFVGNNPKTGRPMLGALPTAPENFTRAHNFDPAFWMRHGAEIEARWRLWRAR